MGIETIKNEDLFGNPIEYKEEGIIPGRTKSGAFINNPLHPLYGKMDGKKCKTCIHLVRKSFSKTYYKCELRGNVDKCSTKSDHKVNWDACGKYQSEF